MTSSILSSVVKHMSECGGIKGKALEPENDAEFYSVVHGFDEVRGYDCAEYDEIPVDWKNRWHLQHYFERDPYNSCYDYRGGNPVGDDFVVENGYSDNSVRFPDHKPTQEELDNDESFDISLGVSVGLYPFLSAGVSADFGTGSNGSSLRDTYNDVVWSLDPNYWPDDQDSAVGVQFDVGVRQFDDGDRVTVVCRSEHHYSHACGRSLNYYSTGEASYNPVVEVAETEC